MEKCFLYLRVSSTQQAKHSRDGFPRQLQACEEYCRANRLQIVDTYREPVTGTEENRPEFERMVSAILSNGVRTVVVEALDRLAREWRVQETLLIYLASKGVSVCVARTGENVTEAMTADPIRRALVQMQAVFSELEKNQVVVRLRAARERKRARGEKADGRLGYRDTPEGKVMIRRLQMLLRKRKYGGKRTLQEVADLLNTEGTLTMDGKRWTPQRVDQTVKHYIRKKKTI